HLLDVLDAIPGEVREAEQRALAGAAADVMSFHPAVIDVYSRAIDDLRSTLRVEQHHHAEWIALLRQLIERIEIAPNVDAESGFEITAYGALATLLKPQTTARTNPTVALVAGEGLEPPTLGL